MVILHDAIQTIQNFFPFSLKQEQNLVSFEKKVFFSKKNKKTGFSQPWCSRPANCCAVYMAWSTWSAMMVEVFVASKRGLW